MAAIDQVSQGGAAVLADIDNFVRGSDVNVVYKAFALVAVLIVFAMIPQTSKFAGYAAWAILLILLVQKGA